MCEFKQLERLANGLLLGGNQERQRCNELYRFVHRQRSKSIDQTQRKLVVRQLNGLELNCRTRTLKFHCWLTIYMYINEITLVTVNLYLVQFKRKINLYLVQFKLFKKKLAQKYFFKCSNSKENKIIYLRILVWAVIWCNILLLAYNGGQWIWGSWKDGASSDGKEGGKNNGEFHFDWFWLVLIGFE